MNQGNAPQALRELRSKFWCHQVVTRLGFKSAAELTNAAKTDPKLGALVGVAFVKYENGQSLIAKTLQAVDEVIEGASDWYHLGPDLFEPFTQYDKEQIPSYKQDELPTQKRIPLWPILEGNREVCRKWVNHVARTRFPDVFTEDQIKRRGWETKAFKLLELITLTSSYNAGYMARIPVMNVANTAQDFFRLQAEELHKAQKSSLIKHSFLEFISKTAPLMKIKPHLVIQAYESMNDTRLNFSAATVLAFIALYHIGIQTENENLVSLVSYVLIGFIETELIADYIEIGSEIEKYIKNEFTVEILDFS